MVRDETIFFSHFHQGSTLSKNLQNPPKGGVFLESEWKNILTLDPTGRVLQKPPFDPRADAENFHFFSSLVPIWTHVTTELFKNFATNLKNWCIYQNIFRNPLKLKIHGHPDGFCSQKVGAHSAIPLWNTKKSTLTIFRPLLSKTHMIIDLVIKTHVFHLEYFMVIKWALYHISVLVVKMSPLYHSPYHPKKMKTHGNPQKLPKKIVLPYFFCIFFKNKIKKQYHSITIIIS